MKSFNSASLAWVLPALVLVSSIAHATEYKCDATNLDTYLVFDDGPGGLDHFDITYKDRKYTTVLFDKAPANTFEGNDSDTPDGKYEYAGDEVALTITGTDGTVFTYDAKRVAAGSEQFSGKVDVTDAGQTKALALRCKQL